MNDLVQKNLSETHEHVPVSPSSIVTTPKELLAEFTDAKEIFVKENITNDTITEIIDNDYDSLELDNKQKKLLDYVIIEFGQNITKHGLQDIDHLKNPISKISLRAGANELYLETENYIENKDIPDPVNSFTDNIKHVGSMGYEELQAEHNKIFNEEETKYNVSSETSRRKGAGLGFVDVAKKIKKMYKHIGQIFVPIIEKVNDRISKFRLITKIPMLVK